LILGGRDWAQIRRERDLSRREEDVALSILRKKAASCSTSPPRRGGKKEFGRKERDDFDRRKRATSINIAGRADLS